MADNTNTWHQNTDFDLHRKDDREADSDTDRNADWRNSVDKLLAGADFEKALVSSTFDDIKIQPLYSQCPNAPFIGRGDESWSIQQSYKTCTLEHVNRQILSDLSGGVTSIELTLARSSDQSSARSSLACHRVDDLQQLLNGVHPEMIRISLTPASDNRLTGALLLAYYHQQKIAPENIYCALNIDPLKTQAETGHCSQRAVSSLAEYASYCAKQFPNTTSICVDSSVYHNAGCTEAQELAYILATTVEYLRALRSLDADTACNQLRFRIALDNDFFINIAKLRALRELLRQIKESCGAQPTNTLIDAVSGSRSLSTLDESVNILRISSQTAAAMVGGASGFNCAPYDHLTTNTEKDISDKSRRLARNTHHVLIEESGLLKVSDPTRGSGYIEALTGEFCKSAWALFQQIESAGGMQQALTSGAIAEQINDSCVKRTDALRTGKSTIIGVTEFPNQNEFPLPAEAAKEAVNSVAAVNTSTATTPATVPALISALSAGESTLDYQTYYSDPIITEPLGRFRDAQLFEELRLRSHAYENTNSSLPEVTLITLGSRKDYAARTGFCKGFFAVAGIQTKSVEIIDELKSEQLKSSKLLVLCSSDKLYLDNAEMIKSLSDTRAIWIAGNNPKVLSKTGGVISESVHLRCDKLGLLNKALDLLGVPA